MSEQGESVYRGKPHKSEITLYDLRESQVGSQEVDLDFLLAAYKLEDRRYLIVDRAKGRVIDTRVTNADADAYF